jgi:hypothetical protein
MRVLVMSRPRFPVPLEQFPPRMEAFAAWRERYRPYMESFDFFVAGGGGCGIINMPDEAMLSKMFMEYPWALSSDVEMHLLMDGDTALANFRAMLSEMGSGQQ